MEREAEREKREQTLSESGREAAAESRAARDEAARRSEARPGSAAAVMRLQRAGGNLAVREEGEDADKREGAQHEGEDADKREGSARQEDGPGSTIGGAVGGGLGTAIGGTLGGMVGNAIGSALGGVVDRALGTGGGGATPTAPPATVSLAVDKATMELGNTATLTATVAGGTATSYTFQVKRASGSTWYDISTGTESSFTGTARVAGQLKLRARAAVGATTVESGEQAVEVQFPSFSTISGNATVRGFCDTAWAETKAATTRTTRREQGFWIQLNTQSMTYQKTATVVGPTRTNDQGASVDFGSRAADSPANPLPNAHAVYTVASFHTHTPMTYRTGTRVTGPSGADQRIDRSDDVTGLVYDWTANPARGGHPLTDPAQIYHSGPTRRSTPP